MSQLGMNDQSVNTSRREFLTGQFWNDTAESSGAHPIPSLRPPDQPDLKDASPWEYLQHFSKRAMACEFQVFLNLHQQTHAPAAVLEAFERIDSLEDRWSIFRPHSELSLLNQLAAEQPVSLAPDLFELLERAQRLSETTDGAFDISSTPLSRTWGFFQRQASVPQQSAIDANMQLVGSTHLRLDKSNQTIEFLKRGIEINLHSIGKGYAVEHAAMQLKSRGVNDFVIHGGQSSVLAQGSCLSRDTDSIGWKIGLSNPIVPENRLAEIVLQDESLGTSGSARQGFVYGGVRYGHIIDPRTGWPARHWLSTTVIHPSATMSDALATAFFVMTEDEIVSYCHDHPEVQAILIHEPTIGSHLEIATLNIDQGRVTFLSDRSRIRQISHSTLAGPGKL
jgi:thiamine biosynthesis lipoprotein